MNDTDKLIQEIKEITRYDIEVANSGYECIGFNVEDYSEGEWIKWEDLEKILANSKNEKETCNDQWLKQDRELWASLPPIPILQPIKTLVVMPVNFGT